MSETLLASRLMDIESRLAFQDHVIETLNQEVTRQQSDLERLMRQVERLHQSLQQVMHAMPASAAPEPPPPHY